MYTKSRCNQATINVNISFEKKGENFENKFSPLTILWFIFVEYFLEYPLLNPRIFAL